MWIPTRPPGDLEPNWTVDGPGAARPPAPTIEGDGDTVRVTGRAAKPAFHYFNKGSMAVVGKDFAILESPAAKMSGRLTWLVWALVHISTLPRLQNQLRVNVQWLWSYFTGQRGSRLIAEPVSTPLPRPAQPVAQPRSPSASQDRRPNVA